MNWSLVTAHHTLAEKRVGSYVILSYAEYRDSIYVMELMAQSWRTKCRGTDAMQACCLEVSGVAGGRNAM